MIKPLSWFDLGNYNKIPAMSQQALSRVWRERAIFFKQHEQGTRTVHSVKLWGQNPGM
jgi:hypothetical protein